MVFDMKMKYDLNIKEASKRLGVSVSTVRRLIKSGQLSKKYVKARRGRQIRVSTDEVDQILNQREQVSDRADELTKYKLVYEESQRQYDELLQRYETVVYRLGATESRLKELEAESLRIQAKKGIFERIKNFFKLGVDNLQIL